jgi:hypothetical protein
MTQLMGGYRSTRFASVAVAFSLSILIISLTSPASSEMIHKVWKITIEPASLNTATINREGSFDFSFDSNTSVISGKITITYKDLLPTIKRLLSPLGDSPNSAPSGCHSSETGSYFELSTLALETVNSGSHFTLTGSTTIYSCIDNPIPNSAVRFRKQRLGPVVTEIPEIYTWSGTPIRNKIGVIPLQIIMPVSASVKGSHLFVSPANPMVEPPSSSFGSTSDVVTGRNGAVLDTVAKQASAVLSVDMGNAEVFGSGVSGQIGSLDTSGDDARAIILITGQVPSEAKDSIVSYLNAK